MSPDQDLTIRSQLQHSIKALTRATIALFLSVILVFGLGFYDSQQRRADLAEAVQKINGALCTFVADIQRRHDDGVKFLEDHPEGIPGISAADIQRSLDAQQSTLDSLSGLDCP